MYATTIGYTFLKAYNNKFQTNYTGRTFFEEVFVPLFFDHPKYMMTAGNSPLENPKLSWEDMIKGKKPFETAERRKERIDKMINKIESEKADASIAIGYGVVDAAAATTGQITNIDFPDNKEDIYCSWIGAGLGVGITGGLTILFNNEALLLDIYEGWKCYRQYLEEYPLMKGNQINTWNGRWLVHRYQPDFDETDPTAGFNPLEPINGGLLGLQTISWVEVLLKIARRFPANNLVGYLYSIGQTNTTIGFIPFKLQDIIRPDQLYEKIFGKLDYQKDAPKVSKLYGTAIGLRAACQAGAIGIPAMEPKGLKAFFPTTKGVKNIPHKEGDEEQRITYYTYLIWILAMLNNEDLWEKSREIAQMLHTYVLGDKKSNMTRRNQVNKILETNSRMIFLNELQQIIPQIPDIKFAEDIGKLIHSMPVDNIPYFLTLVRFNYAIVCNQ